MPVGNRRGRGRPDDDCDGCPSDPTYTQSPYADEAIDTDGDLLPDQCDCFQIVPNPIVDTDADGVRDTCDYCPTAPDTLQLDCDEDREGDACDDDDLDGVLDLCGEGDNCVGVDNPSIGDEQSNCNLDAETATLDACLLAGTPGDCPRAEFVRGDACDPTPCGDALFAGASTASGGRVATDIIRVDAVANIDTPIQARTGFRFCRCPGISGADSVEERRACLLSRTLPTGTVGGCDPLTVPFAYDNRLEEPDSWRWTTVAFTRVAAAPGGLPSGLNVEARSGHARRSDDVFDEDLLARWRYAENDIPRWTSAGDIIPTGPGAFLDGVLLTHQPGGPSGPPGWERVLSSHLESGRVRFPALAPPPVRDCAPAFPFAFSNAFCPFCSASFPRPWAVGFCGTEFRGLIDVAGVRVDPTTLGTPSLPDPPIGGGWLGPSEPLAALRRDSVRVVGFGPGPVVERAFVELGGQLVDLLAPCQVPGQCDSIPLRAGATGTAGPSALLVLSGTRGELYVVGADGVRAFDVRAEVWRHLPAPPGFVRPLAAAYDVTRAELLVLDEISRRVGRRTAWEARISAIPVAAGTEARVLASFPRFTTNDRFALAADVGGDVWVAAGLPVGRAHVLLEFEREADRLRPGGLHAGSGRLARGDALRVDPLGATLLIEDVRLGVTPVGVRHREMVRVSGAAERCF